MKRHWLLKHHTDNGVSNDVWRGAANDAAHAFGLANANDVLTDMKTELGGYFTGIEVVG